jgi:FMN phosphatase YigB (HAD superfamily)
VKPHQSVFDAALEALQIPAERVLFVGDRWDADMVGARNVGMKTCHHIGYTSDLDLTERYTAYRPDYQIRRLEEIEGILQGEGPGARDLGPPA